MDSKLNAQLLSEGLIASPAAPHQFSQLRFQHRVRKSVIVYLMRMPKIAPETVKGYISATQELESEFADDWRFDSLFYNLSKNSSLEDKSRLLVAAASGNVAAIVEPGTWVPYWTQTGLKVLAEVWRALYTSNERYDGQGSDLSVEDLVGRISTHLENGGVKKSVAAAWAAVWLYLIQGVGSAEFCVVGLHHLSTQFEEQPSR